MTVQDPKFTRKDVSTILGVTPLTVSNREKSGKYPPARRNLINNYRIYSLKDIIDLQRITFGLIDHRPIISILYDKGYTNQKEVAQMLDIVESNLKGSAP